MTELSDELLVAYVDGQLAQTVERGREGALRRTMSSPATSPL
jgi:hypothetical protein